MNENARMESVIRAEGLGKTYAEGKMRTPVFDGLNLDVAPGETVAIIGASGAGKSTLLHLLGGLDVPTAGEVHVAGQRMSALSDAARGRLRNRSLGFVYQFHHLLPEFTALENVMMPVLLGGADVGGGGYGGGGGRGDGGYGGGRGDGGFRSPYGSGPRNGGRNGGGGYGGGNGGGY